MALDRTVYWPATEDLEELGQAIGDRVTEYYEGLSRSGLLDRYRQVHAEYYGLDPEGGQHETSTITQFGDDGELLGVRSNQFRSLIKYMLTSATADRPLLQPKAMNNSTKALAQVPTARKVIEYYHKVKRLERKLKATALRALLYGKGYLWQAWDPTLGRMVPQRPQQPPAAPAELAPQEAPDQSQAQEGFAPGALEQAPAAPAPPAPPAAPQPLGPPQSEGDLVYKACSPMEVACDLERASHDHDWFVVRQARNRHDIIAALCPDADTPEDVGGKQTELRDMILDIDQDLLSEGVGNKISFGFRSGKKDSSDIFVYHFMHKRTASVPEGRYTIITGDHKVIFDGPLPYEDITVAEMEPEEFMEAGPVGYSSSWDLIGIQHAYDALLSTCMTNFDAFGHSDMLIPSGVELGVEEVRPGLNAIRYPAGEHNKPSMLEKFSIRSEVFTLKDWLKGDMELITGVNSVARGEPESSLKSGAALALVQAQAIHSMSAFVASYVQLIEDTGTTSLQILRKFAKSERIAAISGAGDPDGLVAFCSSDIDQIDRLDVELGNPLFKTLSGKKDMADQFLERGLITSPAQYFEVLETGRLEVVTDAPRKADLRIHEENELLLKTDFKVGFKPLSADALPGEQPCQYLPELQAMITENPELHIREHASILDSQENRKNPELVARVLAHILDHLDTWRKAPKDLLQLLGFPLPPPLPGDPLAPPEDPAQDPAKKPAAQGKHGEKANAPKGDGTQNGQGPPPEGGKMPSLPKPAPNPLE